ncbi:MAG: DUF4330 family protein [Oscillospiraceae bacterium]|nr:DUF4330 family protein [Oscillospiraceae bacterium]
MEQSGKKRKLNIIDVVVIVVLVAALAFAGYKLLGRDSGELADADALSAPNIRFTVLCNDLDPTLAANILDSLAAEPLSIGGSTVERTRLYNSNKLVDAQVVAFEAVDGAEGTTDLLLTVEANATATPGAYSVVTQEIRIGKDYIVKTIGVEITGQILSLETLG